MKVYIVIHEKDEVYCAVFSTFEAAEAWIKTQRLILSYYRILEEEV